MMHHIRSELLVCACDESAALPCIERFSLMLDEHPSILQPVRGLNEQIQRVSSSYGFHLHSTVRKTTLFYDPATDCFLKILHPLSLKQRIRFLIGDKAAELYRLSRTLRMENVRVPAVLAHGRIVKGNKPFLVMARIAGHSMYDILVRKKHSLPRELYFQVIDRVAELHELGYWFGDAHIDHVFIDDGNFSGFIDIDGMRRNRPFRTRNLAKDLARLNHPGLPLGTGERMALLKHYMTRVSIRNERGFMESVSSCSTARWNPKTTPIIDPQPPSEPV